MANPKRTEIEVYSKTGVLIASFGNPIPTPKHPTAVVSDDERREIMVEPTVKLVQNGESSFTFKMLVSSEKFQLIKNPENRYHVNGRVYTALTDDAIVYGVEGEDARIATVTLVEEQYTLKKKYVQAHNVMTYSKSKATATTECAEYDRTNKVAVLATVVIASSDENFAKALLWDVTDTIYILEPSDTWLSAVKYINPVSITKTEDSIIITFYNYGGTIASGATALFGAGLESIDDHTVMILPKSNNKYKLSINSVQYEDSVVMDERDVLMPRGSAGYALWSVIRDTGWMLGTCDMIHADFNTSQVDAVCATAVRDFTALYGTYKASSDSWVFDLAQNTDSSFRRALNWAVGNTLYIADISTLDSVPQWENAPDSIAVSYFNATDSRITVKFANSGGAISNDCVVAFSNSGAALETKFTVPSTDAGFAYASTWEQGYSISIYDASGWSDAPVSARIVGIATNGDGNLDITILNLGGSISAGATAHFVSGNEMGVFNAETDAKDVFSNIESIQELYGGVIVFDSLHKVIHYRDEDKEGSDFNTWNGFTIKRGKNITSMPSVIWNADMITRLYPLGADKLNISLVNGGKRYVDDFSYTDTIYEGYAEQPNIYDTLDDGGMLQLLNWARREVSKVCRPRKTVKYENKVVDRRQIGGYEFDVFDLNSVVKAYYVDSEKGEETSELLRIVNWEYDVWNPLNHTTLEVGDIHANVRDIFKLIYKKTDEMPAFDAKGRISADDISVGSGSSSGRRGGGGGGGGGTLADALEEQIISNARFFQEFDDVRATIGFEAEYLRTFAGETRQSIGQVYVDLNEQEANLTAIVEHNYVDLDGKISTARAGLEAWTNANFARLSLLAGYYTKDETGTLVSSSVAGLRAEAYANFASATLLAEVDGRVASVTVTANAAAASVASIKADYVKIDAIGTYISGWLNASTAQANVLYVRELIVQNSFIVQPYSASWRSRSVCTSLDENTAYLLSSGTTSFSVVTGVNFSTQQVTTKAISNIQRTYIRSGDFSTINYLGR
jgi:hypothetical protein